MSSALSLILGCLNLIVRENETRPDWYSQKHLSNTGVVSGLVASTSAPPHCTYQSECGDHRLHERHWVEVHWWRHAGHTPPVSNVFHSWPQLQDQRSPLRGDQPQSGHRMRGPDGPRLFSWSASRSKTAEDLAEPSERALMPSYYQAALSPPWASKTDSTLMWRHFTSPPASASRVINSIA